MPDKIVRGVMLRAALRRILMGFAPVAVLLLATLPSWADDVPEIGLWDHYHYSLDDQPVTVSFRHDSGRRDFPALTIPRSYIYFANRIAPSHEGPIADSIVTDHLGIAFADPDGIAWSTTVQGQAAKRSVSIDKAGKTLRADLYIVALYPNTNPAYAETVRANTVRSYARVGEPYPGMQAYSSSGSDVYLLGEAKDKFIQAYCYNPPNAVYFCSYRFVVTDRLTATVKFLDFRVHGGREYANRRVAFARKVICRFLEEC
jgi:hypothetical protein